MVIAGMRRSYYSYSWALEYGRGVVLDVVVESSTHEVPPLRSRPMLRSCGGIPRLRQFSSGSLLTVDGLKASNSFAAPKRVRPQSFTAPALSAGRITKFEIPARSCSVLRWMM